MPIIAEVDYARLVRTSPWSFRIDKELEFYTIPFSTGGEDGREDLIFELVFAGLEAVQRQYHLPKKQLDIVEFGDAWIDAIMNAEIHGNRYDPEKHTWIHYWRTLNCLLFTVKDQGEGFDYHHLQEAERRARGTRQGYNHFRQMVSPHSVGWGLFNIIRSCDVRWNSKGNAITIEKTIGST